jgi:hypothetical protein
VRRWRPLLELRERGLEVEGLDASADMLERCRQHAAERDLEVVLHQQSMETMQLARLYRSIYLAGPTFNLLPDDDTASQALGRIRAHLSADGSDLIPLFVPSPLPVEQRKRPRVQVTDDGTTMRVTAIGQEHDDAARLQTTTLRYERVTDDATEIVERPLLLHWHTQDGFRRMATAAGLSLRAVLTPDATPAGPDDPEFIFWVTPTAPA